MERKYLEDPGVEGDNERRILKEEDSKKWRAFVSMGMSLLVP
jgi:hypothetical protein